MTDKKEKARDKLTSLQVMLPPETHAKFKALCSLRQVKMTAVTTEIIEKWIEEESKKPNASWVNWMK